MANSNAQRKREAGRNSDGVSAPPVCTGSSSSTQLELVCWDPKDGELCLNRAKLEETLVEARSRSDVQIDGQIWV